MNHNETKIARLEAAQLRLCQYWLRLDLPRHQTDVMARIESLGTKIAFARYWDAYWAKRIGAPVAK